MKEDCGNDDGAEYGTPEGDEYSLPLPETLPTDAKAKSIETGIPADSQQNIGPKLGADPSQKKEENVDGNKTPLLVRLVRDEELSPFEKTSVRIGWYSFSVSGFAFVIAFLSLLAAVFAGYLVYRQWQTMNGQWKTMDEQTRYMNEQTGYMNRAAIQARNDSAANGKATATQLELMQRQLREQKDALEISQKANVTIGKPDGTVADIIWPKDSTGNAGIVVYFQNTGHLPTRFNWGADSPTIARVNADPTVTSYRMWKDGAPQEELHTDHYFQPMYRAKKGNQTTWSGTIDIAGGSSYQGILWEIPKERMLQLINFENSLMLHPRGEFEYCDGFGKPVCRRFSLSYAKDPYNRFFLAMEDDCLVMQMQVHRPMPGYKYLPVCSTSDRPELQTLIPTLPKPE